MTDVFRTLIVAAADVQLARSIAASFGKGGENMWTAGLSHDGNEPATHYVSTGYVPEQYAYLVPCQTWELQDDKWVMKENAKIDTMVLYNIAQQAGIKCQQADIEYLFANSDVTEQEPFTAFGRLGLQIINPPWLLR